MRTRVTQSDVAAAAGVSRGLVSLALSGNAGVSDATRAHILDVADRLGYVRNLGAAALAGQFAPAIGMVLPDLRNPFFEEIATALNGTGDANSLLPLIVTSHDDPTRELTLMNKLNELRVSGLIAVSPVGDPDGLTTIAAKLPLTVIGTGPLGGAIDVSHIDEARAAALVADHLRAHGWTPSLHIALDAGAGNMWTTMRRSHLDTALGTPVPHTALVTEGDALTPLLATHCAATPRPAILVHNDQLAVDVVAALRSIGHEPGRDVAVVSYDDTHLAARPEYDITSVHQDPFDLVRAAFEFITSRPDLPEGTPGREHLVTPALTVRSSS